VTEASARSGFKAAQLQAKMELAELNSELGTDVTSAFNAKIVVT